MKRISAMCWLSVVLFAPVVSLATSTHLSSCINQLRQIESGKEQWALETGVSPGSVVVSNEVHQFIKGAVGPTCPSGGDYHYGLLGELPWCTEPYHSVEGVKEWHRLQLNQRVLRARMEMLVPLSFLCFLVALRCRRRVSTSTLIWLSVLTIFLGWIWYGWTIEPWLRIP